MATSFAAVYEIRLDEFRHVTEVTYLGQVYGSVEAHAEARTRYCAS